MHSDNNAQTFLYFVYIYDINNKFLSIIISGLIVVIVSSINISSNLEKITYQKLFVAADGLRQYYEWDIINSGEPAYEHDYVDSLKGEDIELTLFMGDTRFITSALNAQGQRNENTQMDSKIWADVCKGNTITVSKSVVDGINSSSEAVSAFPL